MWQELFGSVQIHVNKTLTLLPILNTISLLFLCLFGYIFTNYHIWKCAQTMWTVPQHCQQLCLFFFLFFPAFVAIFALITIFGNVHRPCRHNPNVVNNCLHDGNSFSLYFPDFLAIFTLITIFGNAQRPCKQLSNITTPSLFFSWFLFLFFQLKMQNLPYLAIFSVHSGHWIPVPFRSGWFWGLFWWNYQNIEIPWQEWNLGW